MVSIPWKNLGMVSIIGGCCQVKIIIYIFLGKIGQES